MTESLDLFDEIVGSYEAHNTLFAAAGRIFEEPPSDNRHTAIIIIRRVMARVSERHKDLTYLLQLEAEMAVRA